MGSGSSTVRQKRVVPYLELFNMIKLPLVSCYLIFANILRSWMFFIFDINSYVLLISEFPDKDYKVTTYDYTLNPKVPETRQMIFDRINGMKNKVFGIFKRKQ
ncbi:hypothetical protein ACOME3_005134 [Neoechinorhynchus agilis]